MKKLKYLLYLLTVCSIAVNAQTKRTLVEEGTGTWCQWCPRGEVFGQKVVKDHNAILIALHNNDPMDNTPGYYNSGNFTGLPSGNVDRVTLDVDPSTWVSHVTTRNTVIPPADIAVTTTYDTNTRSISMTVNATFFAALSGDYRLGAVVVEDGVTGNTTSWDQSNSYSGGGNGPMGGWENKPNPVPASVMVYDHVARHLASTYAGDVGSLPSSIANASQHSHTLSWTLPVDHDPDYTYVVGFITNATTGEVLNVNRSAYLTGTMNAEPFFVSKPKTQAIAGNNYSYKILTHDPDTTNLTISAAGSLPSWLTLSTINGLEAELMGTPPSAGTYNIDLMVSDGTASRIQSFQITASASTGLDWRFVGPQTVTPTSSGDMDLEIDSKNIPYLLHVNSNDQVVVSKFENGSWTNIGNPVAGSKFNAALALAPDDTPYFYTENNGIVVYKYDGSNWVQVGANLGSGVQADITVAPDGTPYVSFMDINASSQGICKKWDGTNWATVGGNHFTSNMPAVWTKVKANSNSEITVLYGTGTSQSALYSHAAKFDGTSWSVLGGGAINGSATTYFNHDLVYDANDDLYVTILASSAQSVDVHKFDGTSWTQIGTDLAGGTGEYPSIALDKQGNPTVGFRDDTEAGGSTVMNYDGSAWNSIGIPGFTSLSSNQSLAYSKSGIPHLAYIDENNSDKVAVKRYGIVNIGIGELSSNEATLQVFPNPSNGKFTLLESESFSYQLINMFGQVIDENQYKLDGNQVEEILFDYQNLPKGLYTLKVMNSKGERSIKIITD